MSKYTKLTLEGSTDSMRAFLAGGSSGKGIQRDDLRRRVLWPQDWDIRTHGTLKGIVDAVLPGDACTVLIDEDIVDEVVAALAPWEKRLELRAGERQRIRVRGGSARRPPVARTLPAA